MASFAFQEIICIFHSGYLNTGVCFEQLLICTAVLQVEHTVANREEKWILQLQTITGACGTIVLFILATLITDVLFKQFLIRTAM